MLTQGQSSGSTGVMTRARGRRTTAAAEDNTPASAEDDTPAAAEVTPAARRLDVLLQGQSSGPTGASVLAEGGDPRAADVAMEAAANVATDGDPNSSQTSSTTDEDRPATVDGTGI